MNVQRRRTIARGATVAALMLAILVATAGCGKGQNVAVDQTDSGTEVTVPQNGTLQVTLYGNPSTGYSWTVVDDAGGTLEQLGDPVAETIESDVGASGPLVGMTERQTFQFDAAQAGSGELKMEYARSFEPTAPPEKTFTLDVTVE